MFLSFSLALSIYSGSWYYILICDVVIAQYTIYSISLLLCCVIVVVVVVVMMWMCVIVQLCILLLIDIYIYKMILVYIEMYTHGQFVRRLSHTSGRRLNERKFIEKLTVD